MFMVVPLVLLGAGCTSPTTDPPALEGAPHGCAWRFHEELQLAHVVDDGADDAVLSVVPGPSARRGTFSVQITTGTASNPWTDLETDDSGHLRIAVADLEVGSTTIAVGRRGSDMGDLATMFVEVFPAGAPALYCAGSFDAAGQPTTPLFFGDALALQARAYQADGMQAEFVVADRDPRAFGDDEYQTLGVERSPIADGGAAAEVVADPSRADDPLETGGPDVVSWVNLLDAKGAPTGFAVSMYLDLEFADE